MMIINAKDIRRSYIPLHITAPDIMPVFSQAIRVDATHTKSIFLAFVVVVLYFQGVCYTAK